MSQHTPGPWRISGCQLGKKLLIEHGDSDTFSPIIGSVYDDEGRLPQKANAAFIVRACNSHDGLVTALKEIATVEGTCTITNGTLSFEDGSTLDLCKLIDAAEAKG